MKSTFGPFSVRRALDEGKISYSSVDVDEGFVVARGIRIEDHKNADIYVTSLANITPPVELFACWGTGKGQFDFRDTIVDMYFMPQGMAERHEMARRIQSKIASHGNT